MKVGYFYAPLILLIPFYDVPLHHISGITVYMLVASLYFFPLLRAVRLDKNVSIFIGLFVCFILTMAVSFLVNYNSIIDGKGLNHIALYAISFFFYTFLVYAIILACGEHIFYKVMSFALSFAAIVGIAEFLSFYVFGFDAYKDFLNHGDNIGMVGGFFPRIRSLFNEPSHYALFLLAFIPFLHSNRKDYKFTYIVVLISFIMTFSAGAFTALFISYCIVRVVFIKRFSLTKMFTVSMLLISLISAVVYSPLWDKITGNTSSSSERLQALSLGLENLPENWLLGSGPTSYVAFIDTTLFNQYFQLYIEGGVLGLCFFLSLYAIALLNCKYRWQVMSLIAIFIQQFMMAHYYIPSVWLIFAFIFASGYFEKRSCQS